MRSYTLSDRIQRYFLYFLLYSCIGWAYEVFLEVVVYRWGYSDRGVLFGPYCPVYGVGALLFLLCFRRLMDRPLPPFGRLGRLAWIFLGCMLSATALELATSYLLEALTGSWPWQTYRDYAWNFQGRIALSPSVRFGLGGLLFLYILQPLFERMVGALPPPRRRVCFWSLAVLFAADCAATWILPLLR